jgi:hypothetical protein
MVSGKMDRKRRTRSENTKSSAAVRIGFAVLKETKCKRMNADIIRSQDAA